jgi:signal peptide peptidase SppA
MDILRLFAGRPLALDRGAIPALSERAAVQLAGADIGQARARHAAAGAAQKSVQMTPTQDVAIVPLIGVITSDPFLAWLFDGTSPDGLVRALRQAVAAGVTAIVMPVDSPGGSVDLIQETAAEIRAINAQVPIIAIARCTAASAAYWLVSQCSEVVASPSSELGSIGVFAVHVSEAGLNEQLGIVPTYIVSAGSPFKVEWNSDAPLSSGALSYQQAAVDGIFEAFVGDVARGRGVRPATVIKNFGGGRMMSAQAAVAAGVADRVDTIEHVIANARRTGPARRASLVAANEKADLELDLWRLLPREERLAQAARAQAEADDLELALLRLEVDSGRHRTTRE